MSALYLTRQFLQDIHYFSASYTLLNQFKKELFPLLKMYPAMGALLLNRPVYNNEMLRLRLQILQQFTLGDIREYCFEHYLIVYFLQHSSLFLLSCIHLSDEIQSLWLQKNTYSAM